MGTPEGVDDTTAAKAVSELVPDAYVRKLDVYVERLDDRKTFDDIEEVVVVAIRRLIDVAAEKDTEVDGVLNADCVADDEGTTPVED